MNALASLLALEKLRLLRSRALLFGALTAGFVVLFAFLARHAGAPSTLALMNEAGELWVLRFLALVLPCAFAAGALSEELSARTLVYLTVRPVPRALIVFAKWLAGALAALIIVVLTTLSIHVVTTLPALEALWTHLPHALTIALAAALEAAFCTSVCLAYGTVLPRGGSVLAFAHLAWFELLVSFAPGRLKVVSMAHHALAFAGLEEGPLALTNGAHAVIVCASTALWLGIAAAVFSVREYRGSESS